MMGSEQKSWLDATPSKTAFAFGLVLGLGAAALVGLVLVLSLFLTGKLPSVSAAAAAGPSPSAQVGAQQPVAPTGPVDIKLTDTDYVLGPKNAKVTVVEYSDFQCPYCGQFHDDAIVSMLKDYKDKIKFVYRDFPLEQIHPFAKPAAIAAECGAEQGKFWQFHDALFAKQASLSDATFQQIAKDVGVDMNKWNECLKSGRPDKVIDADTQGGIGYGVQGTPTTFVNGIEVSGAQPYAALKKVIDSELAK